MTSGFRFPLVRAVLLAMLLLLGAGTLQAHEGHDHGNDNVAASTSPAAPRLEAASGPFELVAILQQSDLVIYLDEFRTNAPISDATIEVETPAGPVKAEPSGDIYRIAASWARPGEHSLLFTVSRGPHTEVLAGTLTIPATQAQGGSHSGSWSYLPHVLAVSWEKLAAGGAIAIAGLSFAVGLLAGMWLRSGRKTLAAVLAAGLLLLPGDALAHEGHDHGSENTQPQPAGDRAQRMADGALFVPKPTQRLLGIRTTVTKAAAHRRTIELPGRIIADPNASGLVQASVSGRLSPPPGGFPRLGTRVKAGDVLAMVTPPLQAIDVSDMRQKAGELDQQIDIVTKRIARYEPLVKSAAISRVTLDEALLELKGLRERRNALDRTRAESERLVAPVAGIIAAGSATAGQIAESNAVIFQIVDPARLWVEALTFAPLADSQPATALAGDGRKLNLTFRGAGLADRSQAMPVHFAIEGEQKGLRIGQLVTVLAATGEEATGVAVPRSSVVRAPNGKSLVFEHTDAERFEPRTVRTDPLDADRMLVREGIAADKRVVVQGAELLSQVR